MKALFLTPSLGAGGAERHATILLPGLRARGVDARLLALDAGGPFEAALHDAGVPFEVLGMRHQGDLRPLAASALVRRFAPEIIVSRGVSGLYVGEALSRWRRSVHVHNDHQSAGLSVSRRREAMIRLLASRLAAVITVESEQLAVWRARGVPDSRLLVIPNGVPAASGRPRAEVRAELGIPPEAVVALLVAGLRPVKRAPDFARALVRARQSEPALVGLIAGGGPEEAAVRAAAGDDVGLRLLGYRDDIPDLLAAADLLVLCSENEAHPMAVLEAMASSLPVLATRVGGVPELVSEGETGLLVAPRDPDALAGALVELAGDRARRLTMGAAGAVRWRERWDAERMIESYLEVFGRVLAGRTRRAA